MTRNIIDRVNPGYEWVFEDEETIAVEKLNGTNVKLLTEGGRLIALLPVLFHAHC